MNVNLGLSIRSRSTDNIPLSRKISILDRKKVIKLINHSNVRIIKIHINSEIILFNTQRIISY